MIRRAILDKIYRCGQNNLTPTSITIGVNLYFCLIDELHSSMFICPDFRSPSKFELFNLPVNRSYYRPNLIRVNTKYSLNNKVMRIRKNKIYPFFMYEADYH